MRRRGLQLCQPSVLYLAVAAVAAVRGEGDEMLAAVRLVQHADCGVATVGWETAGSGGGGRPDM